MKARTIKVLAFAALVAVSAAAGDVMVAGNWTKIVTASDLNSGAGSGLPNFTSDTGNTTLSVSNTGGGSWRILARRSDTSWSGDLELQLRRTSDGAGSGSVSGGEAFVALTNSDIEIFSGSGDRTNISLQTRIVGASSKTAPNTYQASIIYTVSP